MADCDEAALAMALAPGLGKKELAKLLASFETPQQALEASAQDWDLAEVDPQLHEVSTGSATARSVRRVQGDCQKLGIEILALGGPHYPPLLSHIPDAPPVLYRLGTPLPWDQVYVAIVGTRKPSSQGLSFSYRLASALVQAGLVIVSGLALGIDAQAHEATVDVGGSGLAVLAGGLDRFHPPVNRQLAHKLCERGCLITEHPPGTAIHRGQFIGRNRIISGLSQAVAIIEAPATSGAMRTAHFALDQGRSVLVMPGRPGDQRVAGNLQLLRDGASVLIDASDVAHELKLSIVPRSFEAPELGAASDLLAAGSASFDRLLGASGLPAPKLSAVLTRLELAGRLRRGSDGTYYPTE